MIKITNCKELNYIEHFEILESITIKKVNRLMNTLKSFTASMLQCEDEYIIIHNSTKKENTIQVSRFYKGDAIGDSEYNNLFNALYNNQKFNKLIDYKY